MSVKEFQDYWLNVHAVNFASKIKQIKKYKIDTVFPVGDEKPLFNGIAEIWLHEEEQIESLRSDEFLNGARRDEPNWAAFWETIGLDTDAHVIVDPGELERNASGVKLVLFIKRKEGISLGDFRSKSLGEHAGRMQAIPGLKGYYQCHAKDGLYAVGESRLDSIELLWFENEKVLDATIESDEYKSYVEGEIASLVETKWLFRMACKEHWVIGPDFRD